MTLQEFYTRIGGNYDDTLRRIPSEALVRKFVLKYPNDPSFGQLKDALAAQDWETAFRASHTLKGVAQNLGMEHLYQVSSALCEAVRGSKPLTAPAFCTGSWPWRRRCCCWAACSSPLPLACMRRLRRFPLPKSCGWVTMPTPALI